VATWEIDMAEDLVLLECDGPVATLTLNRPDKLNAMDEHLMACLRERLEALSEDDAVRVVIVTGAGRAFMAGADLKAMAGMSPAEAVEFSRSGSAVLRMIEEMDKVFIAAVNGFAFGGGCELMCACDLRVAADDARIGQPEVTVGIHPGFGGTQRLPRLIGPGKAREMILTGEPVAAAEAFGIGLVNRVVPAERLMEEARALAMTLVSRGPTAVRLAKRVMAHGLDVPLEEGLEFESTHFGESFRSGEAKEGMEAFLQKRKPQWS